METLRDWRDERGQSLIEYSLLLGFVALGAVAVFSSSGASARSVWAAANTHLAAANKTVAGEAAPQPSTLPPHEHHEH